MTDDRLETRRNRLDEYLDEQDLEAVWFARPNSFAWLTGGDNVVDGDSDVGVAAAGYDGDFRVVTDNIEAGRLTDEELPDAFDVETFDWYDSSLAEAVADYSPEPAAADFDVADFEGVDASPLRQPLTEVDIERYRTLGRQAAAAIESVGRQLESGDTELEVAAALQISLSTYDINAPVVLVGGAERAQRYRHYTPTTAELGDYALLSITAERGGLYASVTRTVAFDPPEWLAERHRKASVVAATALGATRTVAEAGGTAGDVFAEIQAAYDHVDEPGEWQKHHQGGAAGYAGREWFGTPDNDTPVRVPTGYAWNPTVRGAKCEDTVLVTEDGPEVLTKTGEWPSETVEASDGESSVECHDILYQD